MNKKVTRVFKNTAALPWACYIAFLGSFLLVVASISQARAQCVAPPPDLIGWWSGDGNAADLQGGNNGTLIDGAGFASAKVAEGFSLDGVDAAVRISDPGGAQDLDGLRELTIDAWINPDDIASSQGLDMIVSKYDSTQAAGVSYYLAIRSVDFPGGLILVVRNGGGGAAYTSDAAVIPQGVFSHVAGVWRGHFGPGSFELYVDGQPVAGTLSVSGSPTGMMDNDVPVNIGRAESIAGTITGPFWHFDGIIDEVEIFDRALTADEIVAIFDSGSAGKCKGQPPVAICQDATLSAGSNCTADGFVDSGSFDPDGEPITLSQFPPGPYGLGETLVTLTADDGESTDSCTAKVTVEDSSAPSILCSAEWSGGVNDDDDDEDRVRVDFEVFDNCDPQSSLHARIRIGCEQILVGDGQTIEFECDRECAVEEGDDDDDDYDDDAKPDFPRIEAPSFVLDVTATDASGNVGRCSTTDLCPALGDDDDDDDD